MKVENSTAVTHRRFVISSVVRWGTVAAFQDGIRCLRYEVTILWCDNRLGTMKGFGGGKVVCGKDWYSNLGVGRRFFWNPSYL